MISTTCAACAPVTLKTLRGSPLQGAALVVMATTIAFLPVLQNDFVNWDDVSGLLQAHYYLAYWLFVVERPEEARAEYEQALALADTASLKAASLKGIAASLNAPWPERRWAVPRM